MYISLIAVGRIKEKYWNDALTEYKKRLQKYHRVQVIEVADEKDPVKASAASIIALREKEGEKIRKQLPANAYIIALDSGGKMYDSPGFSEHLTQLDSRGITHLVFLIGGSHGLAPSLLKDAQESISFSQMTFPHQLMRVLFLEQLYRSARIACGEPYHK